MVGRVVRQRVPVSRTAVIAVVLIVAGLLAASERHAQALDAGTLQGVVKWGGAPIDVRLASGTCGLRVHATQGGQTSNVAIAGDGSYVFPVLAPATYDTSVHGSTPSTQVPPLMAGPSAVVAATTTTTHKISILRAG